MKKVLVLSVFVAWTTMVSFCQIKETRQVSGFTGIRASGAFDITVIKGSTESLVIEADENVMPFVQSEVKDGVLRLFLKEGYKSKNLKTLKATVVMKNLDNVVLSGACNLTTDDLFTPDKFKAMCSGASNIAINVNAAVLEILASGASKISIKANVTDIAEISGSGASKIQGELIVPNLKLSASGVTSIDLIGSATDASLNVSGTSNVKAENFTVKTALVATSGTSKITIDAIDALKVFSSGASTVRYKGSPAIETNISGTSKINKF